MIQIWPRYRSFSSSFPIPVALFLFDIAFGLWAIKPGLTSKILWQDDANFLSGLWPLPDSYFAGLNFRGPIFSLFENMDISFWRIWFISIHAVATVALFALFARVLSKQLAILLALTFSMLWFDPKFGLFVIGAEGPATSLWMLALVWLFDRFVTVSGRKNRINFLLPLGAVAVFSVFNAFYAPLLGAMPLLWIGLARIFGLIGFKDFLGGLLATLPAFVTLAIYRYLAPNHYFALGWTESSFYGAWENLSRLGGIFLSSGTLPWRVVLVLLGFTFVLAVTDHFIPSSRSNLREFATRDSDARRDFVLILVALSLVGSVTIPVLMVSVPYAGRYSWAIATAVIILLGYSLSYLRQCRFVKLGVTTVLVFLIIFGGVTRFETQRAVIAANFSAQEKLIRLVEHEAGGWPIGSQIVVITDHFNCCGFFNHWSTGNLVNLSGREDLRGLIGPREKLSRLPFVSSWERDGWWVVSDSGTLKREPMKGLEVSGSGIYIYDLDSIDFFRPLSVTFQGPKCQIFLVPGSSILEANDFTAASNQPDLTWNVDSCLPSDSSARN